MSRHWSDCDPSTWHGYGMLGDGTRCMPCRNLGTKRWGMVLIGMTYWDDIVLWYGTTCHCPEIEKYEMCADGSGTNLLAKRGEVRMICLPSRGRSPRDGRQIILTSPSFARRLIRLWGWRSDPTVRKYQNHVNFVFTRMRRPHFHPLAVRSIKTSTLLGHRNTRESTGVTRPAL